MYIYGGVLGRGFSAQAFSTSPNLTKKDRHSSKTKKTKTQKNKKTKTSVRMFGLDSRDIFFGFP